MSNKERWSIGIHETLRLCWKVWDQHSSLLVLSDRGADRNVSKLTLGVKVTNVFVRDWCYRQISLSLGKARQGKARQGKARQGKARQGKARQGFSALSNKDRCSTSRRCTYSLLVSDSGEGNVSTLTPEDSLSVFEVLKGDKDRTGTSNLRP